MEEEFKGNKKKTKESKTWRLGKVFGTFVVYMIISTIFLAVTSIYLYKDKEAEDYYWNNTLSEDASRIPVDENATKVTVGTYIENIKEISIKDSYYRVVSEVWFKWEGDKSLDMKENFHIYKGEIKSKEVLKETYDDGINYQLIRLDVIITKNYWTPRFPLESHQLRMYVESDYTADKVVFINDITDNSVNDSLSISGYDVRRVDSGIYVQQYSTNHGDPNLTSGATTYEQVTEIEINRSGLGLYIKCFIALYGTTIWVLITLCICAYHKVDPLSLIPPALVGTVSNVLVGANLLPDSLQIGLLEYVNIWGVYTILACAISIIQINRIRTKYKDEVFANKLGRIMFVTILAVSTIGHILLPWAAFMG